MKILIVEDDKDLADSLKRNLENESFAVDVVSDGEEGSFAARTNDYDLIILDLMLPKKKGDVVCREIRQNKKKVPVLMLSVVSDSEHKVDLLDLGADDYLTKPFSFAELVARIRALLRRSSEVEDEVLRVGDLLLDCKRYLVKRGTKEVYLTRKELMLLEYLMRNRGMAVSRAMIMEHVWDKDLDPFSNTIESHILKLRRKLDTKGKKKMIHTIPGRGYMLDLRNI